jgi:hypothetical protein
MRSTRIPYKAASVAAVALAFGAAGPASAGLIPGKPSLAVRPNPDQQVMTSRAAPSASPLLLPNPDQQVSPGYGTVSHPATPAVVRVTTPGGSFNWGDAGIGAAGALGLAIIAFGAGLAIGRRRARPLRSTARIAG